MNRSSVPAGSILAIALIATGCPEPDTDETCEAQGEPTVELSRRNRDEPLVDGAELDTFFAVQGGIFTEIDVRVAGLSEPDVQRLQFRIADRNSGELLAEAIYSGSQLPWSCAPDPALVVEDTPVGFAGIVDLAELEGRAVTLTVVLEHDGAGSPLVVDLDLTLVGT